MAKEVMITYKEYLAKLTKDELNKMLDMFEIEHHKNDKKQALVETIIDNLSLIVKQTLEIFQTDEFSNIKLLIKKKGLITIRVNYLLHDFLKNLERMHLVIKLTDKKYYFPKELVSLYRLKVKNKTTVSKIKENTKEYKLILGFVDTYGVIDFNRFYDNYSKDYKLQKENTLSRLKMLARFYGDINIIEDKKKVYLACKTLSNLKDCQSLLKNKVDYAIYTNEELISIHNFSFMSKFKSYRKLMKFINRNYYVEKRNYKIVNKYVLIPFLQEHQLNKDTSKESLAKLIDNFFEFNNDKHKNKFINLICDITLDYPSWYLKGNPERK